MNRATARLLVAIAMNLAPAWAAHADPARGERVFQRCYACHSVVPGEDKLPGPNLRCVLGHHPERCAQPFGLSAAGLAPPGSAGVITKRNRASGLP